MSTPHSSTKRQRLSEKLHTPRSVFGIRNKKKEETEPGNDLQVQYTIQPERLYSNFHDSDSDDEDYDGLEDLTGKTWKVFRVSPLHNFEYTTVRMKQYSLRLREGLTTLLMDSTNDAHYDVNFSVAEGLAQTQNDNEAVKITVNMKKKNGENVRSKHYIGFLVCRGASKALGEEATIHLPLLLCSGTVRTTKSIHHLLRKFFDCSIDAYQITQEDLAWLCALQADEKDTRKGASQVEMTFSFPQLSVRNRIQFKIPLTSVKYLWKSIHDYNSEYASFEEVSRFYEALQQQLARVYEFNIEKGQLMRIKTPTLTISNETKLMAKTGRVLNYVLKFLYEGSAVIDTCAPTLSVEPD